MNLSGGFDTHPLRRRTGVTGVSVGDDSFSTLGREGVSLLAVSVSGRGRM